MAKGTDFDKLCPLFNFNRSRGVLFPYYPMAIGQYTSNAPYVDFDASASTIHARVRFPMKVRLVTCEVFAAPDGQGAKAAAASTEPVIGIGYGTASLASIDAGTEISTITCDGAGAVGDRWTGNTTPTTIQTTEELLVYLKTAAASATSANQDGGGAVVLWLAHVNAP